MILAKPVASERVTVGSAAMIARPDEYRTQKFYQNSGFQIFLLLAVIVFGVLIFWWITTKSHQKNQEEK